MRTPLQRGTRWSIAWVLLGAACSSPPAAYDRGLSAWKQLADQPPANLPAHIDDSSTLDDQVRWASFHNPEVRAASQRWRAALEVLPQATALPDPRLTLGWFVSEVETRTGPMDWRLGISQSLPWFGTLDLLGRIEASAAESAREHLLAARLEVVQTVREAFYELAWLAEDIEVTRAHRDLLVSWETVARTRYATGLGTDTDVLRAQVELGRLDDRLLSLQDLRRPLAARLNAALDRPADAALPSASLAHVSVEAGLLDADRLRADLDQTSPILRSLQWKITAAEDAIALADKRYYPDVSFGLDYTRISSARAAGVSGSGDDVLALTSGISLPLRRTRLAAAAFQAEAELAAARADLDLARNDLSARLELALYHVRDAERRIDLYLNSLVPKGRQSVSSTTTAYQAGDADFLDLVDAQRVLLEFQRATARARADHAQALARVERLTGKQLLQEN
jgi:outer membrane protein TolC